MIVKWSARAIKSLHVVEAYILQEFGEQARAKFMSSAKEAAERLEQFPMVGQEEPLLTHRKNLYRSLVIERKSKMIYYSDDQLIIIADFWECRREPAKNARGL